MTMQKLPIKNVLQRASVLLSLLAASLAGRAAQPVFAHADLVSAEPAVNASLTKPPTRLRLVFDETLASVGTKVALINAAGAAIELPKGSVDPSDPKAFIVEIPSLLSAGAYTVRWTAVSDDGHAEKGSYGFKVVAAAATASDGNQSIRFALRAGKSPITCATQLKGLGSKKTAARLLDARLHVSNVRLIDAAGKETPVVLANDGKWQDGRVALLDFENGAGLCREGGNPDLRDVVSAKMPAGTFTGLVFDVGVPQQINHVDVALAKSPLNVSAMWWNWQNGYKFLRLDLKTAKDAFLIHLGSTGCGEAMMEPGAKADATSAMTGTTMMTKTMVMDAGNKPPTKPCANPNRITVRLNKFDRTTDVVVLDVEQLLSGVDISAPSPQPSGCMSGTNDTDCSPLFANMGLSIASGLCEKECAGQRLFRVEAAPKQ